MSIQSRRSKKHIGPQHLPHYLQLYAAIWPSLANDSGLQDASQAANRFLPFTPPFSQTHQAEPREAGYAGVSSNSDTVQLSDDVYVRTDIGCLHVDKL
jgi:hypothetical protein